MRSIRMLFLALSAVGISPTMAISQAADSTVRQAVERIRAGGSASNAARVLAQERGSLSARARDELADSLVAIATRYREGGSPAEDRAAMTAATALLGSADPARTVPYPRAFEMLVRIYEGSQDVGIRGATLYFMTELPSVGRTIAFLADVAASTDRGGPTPAIRLVAERTGPAGLDRLKRLYETDAVVEPNARHYLRGIAEHLGWVPQESVILSRR